MKLSAIGPLALAAGLFAAACGPANSPSPGGGATTAPAAATDSGCRRRPRSPRQASWPGVSRRQARQGRPAGHRHAARRHDLRSDQVAGRVQQRHPLAGVRHALRDRRQGPGRRPTCREDRQPATERVRLHVEEGHQVPGRHRFRFRGCQVQPRTPHQRSEGDDRPGCQAHHRHRDARPADRQDHALGPVCAVHQSPDAPVPASC